MSQLTQPVKWFGGKHYLAGRIVALMQPHLHYVEPFAGGLSVLLKRDPDEQSLWLAGHHGVSELVNDLDGRLVNFYRVLRNPELFPQLQRMVALTPLSRVEWEAACNHVYGKDAVADAAAFFVFCRQSRAGEMKSFTPPTRQRTRRGMNGNASEWLGAIAGLEAVHQRLSRVVVECMDAMKLIPREDTPGTLFYCDPPYLHETRVNVNGYHHEMSEGDHLRLLQVLLEVQGKVMLSGYRNDLYDAMLDGWQRHEFELPNNAAGGTSKRRMTECLWCNY